MCVIVVIQYYTEASTCKLRRSPSKVAHEKARDPALGGRSAHLSSADGITRRAHPRWGLCRGADAALGSATRSGVRPESTYGGQGLQGTSARRVHRQVPGRGADAAKGCSKLPAASREK